jgi:uncharacterized membrane protein
LTAEVLNKFSTLITTALGLVAALAWNTAIQNLFEKIFGQAGGELVGQFFYAILITLVVIFATIYVGRAAEKAKKAEEDRGNAAVSSSRAVSPRLSAVRRWRGGATGRVSGVAREAIKPAHESGAVGEKLTAEG